MSTPKKMRSYQQPEIVQASFIISADRQYTFDVNEDITFNRLKKMLSAAAAYDRVKLKIFHEGKEYTQKEAETLCDEFPNQKRVVFDVRYFSDNVDDYDHLLQIGLNQQFCPKPGHTGKYTYFYCFPCKSSICSQCLLNENHDHFVNGEIVRPVEKYDYLQNSKFLTDKLFKDVSQHLDNLGKDDVENLRHEIEIKFAELIGILQQIQKMLCDQVGRFYEVNNDNIEQLRANYLKLKKYCTEGLDRLKNNLDIEDLMLDEQIFLTFHAKYKEIEKEKEKFLDDISKQKNITSQLDKLREIIQNTYQEIFDFLMGYLKDRNISGKIEAIEVEPVEPVDRQKIISGILKGVQTKDKEDLRNRSYRKQPKEKDEEIEEEYMLNLRARRQKEIEDHIKNCEHCSSLKKNAYEKDEDLISITSDTEMELRKGRNIFICQPILGTSEVLAYCSKDRNISHNTLNTVFFQDGFLDGCAWVNYKNNLYITGGLKGKCVSQDFFKYNPVKNEIQRLSPMPEGRYGHSMVQHGNSIYLVGGNDKHILRFDFRTNKWSKEKLQLTEKRYHPVTFVKDGILYAIFGQDEKRILPTGEKGRIGSSGKMGIFLNDEKRKRIFPGVLFSSNDEILMVGGENDNKKILDSTIRINLSSGNVANSAKQLTQAAYFAQPILPICALGSYGYFSKDDSHPFVCITLNSFN